MKKFITIEFDKIKWKLYRERLKKLAAINNPSGRRLTSVLSKLHRTKFLDGNRWKSAIERERKLMLSNQEPLIDGSLGKAGLYDDGRTVKDACEASKDSRSAAFLFLLIREFKPSAALELGTNVGITSAYQTAGLKSNGSGELITLEASPYRMRLAEQLHKKLKLTEHVDFKVGLFQDTLDTTLQKFEPIDYAFIDGHHQYQPTLDYFDLIYKNASDEAVFVFDDINWSPGMKRAWQEIKNDERLAVAADFGSVGIGVKADNAVNSMPYTTKPIRLL